MKVKYGRVDGNAPKNTLVTIREGDTVFFGIARCNMGCDNPVKEIGKILATERALLAQSGVAKAFEENGEFLIHKSRQFGKVSMEELPKLLEYFDNVDQIERDADRS